MKSQIIKILVLFIGVGVFALPIYCVFDWQVAASSPQTQDKTSNQFSNTSLADNLIHSNAKSDFGNLPLYFALNQGQMEQGVKYYSMGSRYALFLTQNGAILRLVSDNTEANGTGDLTTFEKAKKFNTDEVHLNFVGANMSEPLAGEEELPGKVNYFVGNDASQWQTGVSTFAKIRYKSIYPGIDALFYGNQRQLEYDFVIAPQANPHHIELAFQGAEKIVVNKRGELALKLKNGEILQRKPVAYQFINGKRKQIKVSFVKKGDNRIAFRLGKYDLGKELIIDPIIIFSSFFGGSSSETATAVKTDAEGNIYLTGGTASSNFPTVNPQQPIRGGNSTFDAFVTKINPAGNSIIYSTYLGGEFDDLATGLNVDTEGNVVITGRTLSTNFPTLNALQPQTGGGVDGFVAKLNLTGSALIFSTFLGGTAFEDISSVALDSNGNAIVAGRTESANFPTVNPLQATRSGNSLFRSLNTGNSWTSGTISPNVTTVSSFAVNPDSPKTVFAATNIGVFRSNDGGETWSAAGQSDLAGSVTKIAVARFNPNVVYAISNGGIYKSSNGGNNWTNIQGNLFSFFNIIAVDPNNADTAFVGGFSGVIYKTTDGGANWTNVSLGNSASTVNSLVVDPSNPQIVYVGTAQRIYKSTVGGGNWVERMSGIPFFVTFWDLLISPTNNTIYAASQNGLYKSSDAGTNWTQVNAVNLVNVRSLSQDPNNPANLFAATGNGLIFRSIDDGTSWNQSNNGLTGNTLYAVASTSNSTLLGGYSGTDAFVARLSATGNALEYSTFFGGNLNDSANGVRVDVNGRITFAGTTNSSNFPTLNAIQPVLGGGNDAFIAKFAEGGASLLYSTFQGGALNDTGSSLALDSGGNAYLTGSTLSSDFPVQNALQSNCASCAAFTNDAFVTKLSADGSTRIYSTFLGGSFADNGMSIEVDLQNRAIIAGSTSSNNFPVLDAIQPAIASSTDGFVSQIKADGSNFVYSTYLGGSGNEIINSITVSTEGNAVLTGQTSSVNFPTVRALQNTYRGSQDIFIAKIGVAADLEIIKTDERDPVMINNSLSYSLGVKNNGPSAATRVVVTDMLPESFNFVSVTPTQGSCTTNGSTLTCNLGDLVPNAQAVVRLILTPTATGTFSSTATVKGNEPDPISANNNDIEQTVISALPSIFGRVTSENGQLQSNVNISVEGFENRTVQTNALGTYLVTELPLNGNYTVRPVKEGYYFSPRSRIFNSLSRDETADFVISSCSYTLSTNSANLSAAGGNQSVFITANDPFCAWSATSNVPWIFINSGNNGFGNGAVKISIESSNVPRTGTITIAGQTFTITQSGCNFELMPFHQSFNQNGGTGTIAVMVNQNFCQWTAEASDAWITVTNSSSANGNGTISYKVAPTTRPRNGRIIVAGKAFPIWQEYNFCPAPVFGEQLEATINAESLDIVTADFNKDTIPDLATVDVTSSQSSTFTTYIGKGDGTFNRNTMLSSIGSLTNLAAGDFNRDSNIDIAIIGSGKIAILNGNGNGTLTLFTSFEANTGYSYAKMFVEDYNRDGNLDLLVGVSGGMYLYNGKGDGTFTTGTSYQIGGRTTYSYAVGDLNGDGATDVIVGNEEDFGVSRLIYFFGSNIGTFTQGGIIPLGNLSPYKVKAADLNGDGKADVIASGVAGSQVRVFLWNPELNVFRAPIKVFTEPFTAIHFEVADVNNDSIPDIISTSSEDFPRRISIMRGNGNGTFRLPIGSKRISGVNAMTFADFNRDGRLDLALAKEVNQMSVQLNLCDTGTTGRPKALTTKFDFDGDRKADFSVIRPSDNTWYLSSSENQSMTSIQLGIKGDISVPADYDGDGLADLAVFRPTDGNWYRLNSSDNSMSIEQWGKVGDIPTPGDYDGDERADLAVFRPENRIWYWVSSQNGQYHYTQFGLGEDIPVIGDYDGDTKADIAVFRPSNGGWYWLNSSNGEFNFFQFGLRKDKAVPGDYDGDGKTDIAVFRPSEKVWYLMKTSDNQPFIIKFGLTGDIPTPADYDGDGKTDFAIFRPSNGSWWYAASTLGGQHRAAQFGFGTDIPIPSAYIR